MPSLLTIACALLAGSLSLTIAGELPGQFVFAATGALAFVMLARPRWRLPAAFLAGLSIAGIAAYDALGDRLAPALTGRDISFSGRIVDFPRSEVGVIRFTVAPLDRPDLPGRIRLTWVDGPGVPRIGETWRLTVRLRRPGGYSNPHGFDFEKWLFRERIGATGYVVEDAHHYRITGQPVAALDEIRRRVVDRIDVAVADEASAAVLMAIAVGARHRIAQPQWDEFAATGTSHLMAISGLHVGLAAASAYCLLRMLIAPLSPHRNARAPALAGAAMAATAYAALSGLGLPALRALLMMLIALSLVMNRRKIPPATLFACALLLVFVSDPLSTLSPGFRLSFGAVAVLFLSLQLDAPVLRDARYPVIGKFRRGIQRLANLQLALLIGLFPLTIIEFDRVSVAAPVANMLAMPVFNFITVPSILLGALLDGPFAAPGNALIGIAGDSVRWTLSFIAVVGSLEVASFETASPVPWFVLLLAPISVLCPRGVPGRGIGFACLVYALTFKPAPPPARCVDLYTLDVGQGLAVVARTQSATVLYDTGPEFRGGGGTVDLVVRPFLQSLGVRHLDRVVLSHDDLDHSGGIHTLLERIDVGAVIASTPALRGVTDTRCVAGHEWRRDGVTFRILHPRPGSPWTGNNASCVLEIRTGDTTVLLPGDIEKPVEVLMAWRNELPKSDVVVVPHHGSRTSSSDALVRATRPAIAIVPSAWRNRWGFPKPDVVNRWRRSGALVLNTATDGAIATRICADGIRMLERNREQSRRYWHEDRKSPS